MRTVVNKESWVGDARMLAVILAVILALAILVPMRAARASNVISGASGPVSVEFVSTSADFINTMSVTAPVNRVLFNTQHNRIGTRVELGTFSSGTTFRFQLQARTADGSFTWSSDPAQTPTAKITCASPSYTTETRRSTTASTSSNGRMTKTWATETSTTRSPSSGSGPTRIKTGSTMTGRDSASMPTSMGTSTTPASRTYRTASTRTATANN